MKKLISFVSLVALLNFVSCAKKADDSDSSSSSSNKQVTLKFGEYTTASYSPLNLLIPNAHAAISGLKFCFKRLRFKPAEEVEETADNIDFDLGEQDIGSTGTVLGTISVPAGEYRRIEIDLEPTCGAGDGWSAQLVNDHGSFELAERVTIKFEGTYIVNAEETFNLDVQPLMDALNAINDVANMGDAMEDSVGE
jgi:hypothetical protein